MLFNFFKNREVYIEPEPGGRKKTKALIFLIIAAIFILAFGGFGKSEENDKTESPKSIDNMVAEKYIAESEKRLAKILSNVEGAGKVETMITVDNMGEKVIAMDKKSESHQENSSDKSAKTSKQENHAIIYGSGNDEQPFVLNKRLPVPSGVLVVAEGAGSEHVRLEIYEAVKALYGISGHRIKVTKGSLEK